MDYDKYQKSVPTEISYNLDVAMPYGDMPNEALMAKFEETQDLDDGEDQYDNYARDTLRDFSSDPIGLESDMVRRDATAASGMVNTRYYGGRGKLNNPAHPEMFLGETTRDPRGVATDPNMLELKRQSEARMRFVRFSADADNSVHEGRWSESQAYNKSRLQTHKAVRDRARIFSTSKDGRREGLRREYYPHVSNVNKVQEDLSRFRPAGSDFSDYIADYALNPQKKTAQLSDTILTNSRLYHQFSPDHEFSVARYGEDARRKRITESRTSRVQDAVAEHYFDIPGGEYVEAEGNSKAFKAAGILMGAIVNQKHQSQQDQIGGVYANGNGVEGEASRKTTALSKDLALVMRGIQQMSEFSNSDNTRVGKTAAPQRAEHLVTAQETTHARPSHQLHTAERMFKSVKPTGDMDLIRREVLRDGRSTYTAEDSITLGKTGKTTATTGKQNSIFEVDGKSMSTPTYKSSKKVARNRDAKIAAITTENFGGSEDNTQNRSVNHTQWANPSVDDVNVDQDQFHVNSEDAHRKVRRGGDKFGLSRHTESDSRRDDALPDF